MKSGISVTGKATTHDCAEDVGVACYRNVSAWCIKGCENIPRGIDFDCLRNTRSGGADPKKLHVTDPTRVRIISWSWRDQRRDAEAARVGGLGTSVNILIIEVACFHLHVPGEPGFRRLLSRHPRSGRLRQSFLLRQIHRRRVRLPGMSNLMD